MDIFLNILGPRPKIFSFWPNPVQILQMFQYFGLRAQNFLDLAQFLRQYEKAHKKVAWILMGVCFLLLILYLSTRRTGLVEWNDFVQIRGVAYSIHGKYPSYTTVSADRIGEKIGKVTRRPRNSIYIDIFGNVYPKLKDGTAYKCPMGTELFSIIDRGDV